MRHRPLTFVVLLGVVSLFADMTYEGARGATGPWLGMLGASAFAVAVISGGGELVGYALRLWSGRLVDRSQRYWLITFFGYAINLLAVPLLAFAGRWPTAAALIVLERAGKALRTPARDAMLSFATSATGRGWGFGLHEALDQIGATIGPLVVAAVVLSSGDYRLGFAVLIVPALAALGTLAMARQLFPRPESLEPAGAPLVARRFPRRFWLYLVASGLVAAGYADYPLMAFHLARVGDIPPGWIAALYALAMGVDAMAAVGFGRWFDRVGTRVLVVSTLMSSGFAPLVFGGRGAAAIAGTALWGIGMGAQESVMRAAVADLAPPGQRGTAYGVFNLAFGCCWFAGTALMGWLYAHSMTALVAFSVVSQLLGAVVFATLRSRGRGIDP